LQWAQSIELPVTDGDLDPSLEFEHMTLARVYMAQGRLDEAAVLLARLFTAANRAGRMGRAIAICVLQAQVASLLGQTDRAMKSLAFALEQAEPEGYVRVFLDEGPPMQALLREALARGIAPAYVTQLLAAFAPVEPSAAVATQETVMLADIEALSEREIEVLQLVADGASNREVADTLFIRVGTVKKHLNNIFLKLDAQSRTQAVSIARELNLL
jgi:LuxR family maltose regulon positive regulatory protein